MVAVTDADAVTSWFLARLDECRERVLEVI
jgi:hypothetical protein